MQKIEFNTVRAEQTKVIKQDVSQLYVHDAYIEIMLSYDFKAKKSKEDVETLEVVRMHQVIPKQGLAITRTYYTNELDERPAPDELPPLYSAIILEYQGREFWLYMEEDECNKVFKLLRGWLIPKQNQKES